MIKLFNKEIKNYLFHLNYDKEGWWVTVPSGSKMHFYFAFLKCKSVDNLVLYNFIFWRWQFTFAKLNQHPYNSPESV